MFVPFAFDRVISGDDRDNVLLKLNETGSAMIKYISKHNVGIDSNVFLIAFRPSDQWR